MGGKEWTERLALFFVLIISTTLGFATHTTETELSTKESEVERRGSNQSIRKSEVERRESNLGAVESKVHGKESYQSTGESNFSTRGTELEREFRLGEKTELQEAKFNRRNRKPDERKYTPDRRDLGGRQFGLKTSHSVHVSSIEPVPDYIMFGSQVEQEIAKTGPPKNPTYRSSNIITIPETEQETTKTRTPSPVYNGGAKHFQQQSSGILRPGIKVQFPPNLKRRRRIIRRLYNGSRRQSSTNPFIFARDGDNIVIFGRKRWVKGRANQNDSIRYTQEEIKLENENKSMTTSRPIPLSRHNENAAMENLSHDTREMRLFKLINSMEIRKINKNMGISDKEINENDKSGNYTGIYENSRLDDNFPEIDENFSQDGEESLQGITSNYPHVTNWSSNLQKPSLTITEAKKSRHIFNNSRTTHYDTNYTPIAFQKPAITVIKTEKQRYRENNISTNNYTLTTSLRPSIRGLEKSKFTAFSTPRPNRATRLNSYPEFIPIPTKIPTTRAPVYFQRLSTKKSTSHTPITTFQPNSEHNFTPSPTARTPGYFQRNFQKAIRERNIATTIQPNSQHLLTSVTPSVTTQSNFQPELITTKAADYYRLSTRQKQTREGNTPTTIQPKFQPQLISVTPVVTLQPTFQPQLTNIHSTSRIPDYFRLSTQKLTRNPVTTLQPNFQPKFKPLTPQPTFHPQLIPETTPQPQLTTTIPTERVPEYFKRLSRERNSPISSLKPNFQPQFKLLAPPTRPTLQPNFQPNNTSTIQTTKLPRYFQRIFTPQKTTDGNIQVTTLKPKLTKYSDNFPNIKSIVNKNFENFRHTESPQTFENLHLIKSPHNFHPKEHSQNLENFRLKEPTHESFEIFRPTKPKRTRNFENFRLAKPDRASVFIKSDYLNSNYDTSDHFLSYHGRPFEFRKYNITSSVQSIHPSISHTPSKDNEYFLSPSLLPLPDSLPSLSSPGHPFPPMPPYNFPIPPFILPNPPLSPDILKPTTNSKNPSSHINSSPSRPHSKYHTPHNSLVYFKPDLSPQSIGHNQPNSYIESNPPSSNFKPSHSSPLDGSNLDSSPYFLPNPPTSPAIIKSPIRSIISQNPSISHIKSTSIATDLPVSVVSGKPHRIFHDRPFSNSHISSGIIEPHILFTHQPVTSQPITHQPVTTESVTRQPVSQLVTHQPVTRPFTRHPHSRPPITHQPVTTQSVPRQPNTHPVTRQPITSHPYTRQSVTRRPVTRRPVTHQPVTTRPVTRQPVTGRPVTHQPVTRLAVTSHPVTRQPLTRRPVTHQPVITRPVTRQPVTRRPVPRQPVTRRPVTRQPVTRRPVTHQPVTRRPLTRQSVTRQPVASHPVTHQPVTRRPVTRQPVTKRPFTRQPVTRRPVTRQPVTRRLVTHQPVTAVHSVTDLDQLITTVPVHPMDLGQRSLNSLKVKILGELGYKEVYKRKNNNYDHHNYNQNLHHFSNDITDFRYPEITDGFDGMILSGVSGVASVDYPMYSTIPPTSFSCIGRTAGYYADPEARCQVFHMCHERGRRDSFLCPNGTVFHQGYLTCDHWYKVDCHTTTSLHSFNNDLYHYQKRKREDNGHKSDLVKERRRGFGRTTPRHTIASKSHINESKSHNKADIKASKKNYPRPSLKHISDIFQNNSKQIFVRSKAKSGSTTISQESSALPKTTTTTSATTTTTTATLTPTIPQLVTRLEPPPLNTIRQSSFKTTPSPNINDHTTTTTHSSLIIPPSPSRHTLMTNSPKKTSSTTSTPLIPQPLSSIEPPPPPINEHSKTTPTTLFSPNINTSTIFKPQPITNGHIAVPPSHAAMTLLASVSHHEEFGDINKVPISTKPQEASEVKLVPVPLIMAPHIVDPLKVNPFIP